MAFDFRRPVDGVGQVVIPAMDNVYVVGNGDQRLLIDCGLPDKAGELIATLEANGVRPGDVRAIVVTHGHADHFGGVSALVKWSGAPVWAHLSAAAKIEDRWSEFVSPACSSLNLLPSHWQDFRDQSGEPVRVSRILREGDAIDLAACRLEVLHTPGHDASEVTLWDAERRLAFVGDLVQGGSDASANWLGLFSDVASQRKSLARVVALKPTWLFKGHRRARDGGDILVDLASAVSRLGRIEQALLTALAERSPMTLADLTKAAMKRVLDISPTEPPAYANLSVAAFLIDMSHRGLVRRSTDLNWERPEVEATARGAGPEVAD